MTWQPLRPGPLFPVSGMFWQEVCCFRRFSRVSRFRASRERGLCHRPHRGRPGLGGRDQGGGDRSGHGQGHGRQGHAQLAAYRHVGHLAFIMGVWVPCRPTARRPSRRLLFSIVFFDGEALIVQFPPILTADLHGCRTERPVARPPPPHPPCPPPPHPSLPPPP